MVNGNSSPSLSGRSDLIPPNLTPYKSLPFTADPKDISIAEHPDEGSVVSEAGKAPQ